MKLLRMSEEQFPRHTIKLLRFTPKLTELLIREFISEDVDVDDHVNLKLSAGEALLTLRAAVLQDDHFHCVEERAPPSRLGEPESNNCRRRGVYHNGAKVMPVFLVVIGIITRNVGANASKNLGELRNEERPRAAQRPWRQDLRELLY